MRRWSALLLALTWLPLSFVRPHAATGSPETDSPAAADPLAQTGVYLGASVTVGHNGSEDHQSAVEMFEGLIQRDLAVERVYYLFDEPFPSAYDYWSRDQGRLPLLSLNAAKTGGGYAKWRDIASGMYDDVIDARARDIRAFGSPLFFIFHHEPERGHDAGTSEEFIDAYRHIHRRFDQAGVTNALYVVNLMAYTFRIGDADRWYPGDDVVDLIAADGYNWYGCPGRDDGWNSFADVFSDFHDYGAAHGKPMIIAEWASTEDPLIPFRKAIWITEAAVTLKSWPDVKVVTWYDNGPPYATCTWWVDTSATSLAAFTALGADPYFNPPTPSPPDTGIAAYVDVRDFDYGPVGTLSQGGGVSWLFRGPSSHSATDSSGMDLFDSGPTSPSGSFSFTFVAAGNFPYQCSVHPAKMSDTMRIPIVVRPEQGDLRTSFKVQWASAQAPPGYAYDIQILRPDSGEWEMWAEDQTAMSANFEPDSGRGVYEFRARMRNVRNGESSWYSDAQSILVE